MYRRRYSRAPTRSSNNLLFVALHESVIGTSRTYQDVRYLAALGGKADTAGDARTMAIYAYTPWRAREKNGAPKRPARHPAATELRPNNTSRTRPDAGCARTGSLPAS